MSHVSVTHSSSLLLVKFMKMLCAICGFINFYSTPRPYRMSVNLMSHVEFMEHPSVALLYLGVNDRHLASW